MRAITKLLASTAVAASIAVLAMPAQAADNVFIGLQNAGANGGLLTTVASGAVGASYGTFPLGAAYGNYEVNLLTGVDGFDPVLLDTTISVHNKPGTTAGQFDLYFTLKDITGPLPGHFFDSFTTNTLPAGWTIDVKTLVDPLDGIYSGAQIYSTSFSAIGTNTFWSPYSGAGLSGPYSVTQHYTIHTPAGAIPGSQVLATGNTEFGAIPEPASWALMITGFGAMGAALRSRRQRGLVAAA